MEQPAIAEAPPAAPVTPAPGSDPMDVKQIKSMLQLPETASDIELITALVELISNLQQKYDALLGDAVKLEDTVKNRMLLDFADVITPETKPFWEGQILENREQAEQVLTGIRAGKQPAAPAAPQPAPREPLRNRLVDRPKSVAELAGETPPADLARAVAIRNRAHVLRTTEKLPWGQAFARAEKEMNK